MNPQDNNQDTNTQNQAMPETAPIANSSGNSAPQPVTPNTNPMGDTAPANPSVDTIQPSADQSIQPMAAVAKPKKSKTVIIIVIAVVVIAIVAAAVLLV